ncbi:hypothetical protein GCM10027060_23490 [Nesterenkonia halophila]
MTTSAPTSSIGWDCAAARCVAEPTPDEAAAAADVLDLSASADCGAPRGFFRRVDMLLPHPV